MMSPEDNDLLTRVEGDAPMGRLLSKNFWIPALRGARLEAGGRPVRVRLFGRNYVAFRASSGEVGILDERCPHRGVSLMLARNENCTLRCLFHGWRMDTAGNVVEVPNEPNQPQEFCKTVPVNRYRAREAGPLVWVWVGSGEVPPFPDFEFNALPSTQVAAWFQPQECNWFQAVEGAIDSSHVGMLHTDSLKNFTQQIQLAAENNAPRFEISEKDYGYEAAALRTLKDGSQYVRVTQYVAPWASFIPPGDEKADRLVHFIVPVDDLNCIQLVVRYNLHGATRAPAAFGEHKNPDAFSPLPGTGPDDCWGQDGEAMTRGTSFTGFPTLFSEDYVAQVSQGRIADRSLEYLCSGDTVIVRARRLMLKAVKQFVASESSAIAAAASSIEWSRIRSRAGVIAAGADWRVALHEGAAHE